MPNSIVSIVYTCIHINYNIIYNSIGNIIITIYYIEYYIGTSAVYMCMSDARITRRPPIDFGLLIAEALLMIN